MSASSAHIELEAGFRRKVILLLKILCCAVFFARAYQCIVWDAPFRASNRSPKAMRGKARPIRCIDT
ncbi:MAG: hypothetical protein AAF570_20440, partial [Bacteroidota bacterium]